MEGQEDFYRLRGVVRAADENMSSIADADGNTAGVNGTAIKAMAIVRTDLVLDHLSQLPKVLTEGQLKMVRREMITMWMDAFTIGRLSAFSEKETA